MKKMILCAALIALAATGCMSDNKLWLRTKELEAKQSTPAVSASLEGPATLTIEQGGKATFNKEEN